MISKLLFEQYYLDIIVLTLGLHLHLFDALNENTSVLNLVCPTTTNEVVNEADMEKVFILKI